MTSTPAAPVYCLLNDQPPFTNLSENHPDTEPSPLSTSTPEICTINENSTFGLVELLLKDQPRFNDITRQPAAQRRTIPGLLAIGLGGYSIFALVLSAVFCFAGLWPRLIPLTEWLEGALRFPVEVMPLEAGGIWHVWRSGQALHLTLAYVLGLVGAIGICLPSFYFYSLLAGVRTSMLQVATSALNGLASGAIAVLGILPIYLAVMLGLVILKAPAQQVQAACLVGMTLPFLAGLYGTRALYLGFTSLADTIPENRRGSRERFLRRLLLAWSGCYSTVTPVMIFALWEYMGR